MASPKKKTPYKRNPRSWGGGDHLIKSDRLSRQQCRDCSRQRPLAKLLFLAFMDEAVEAQHLDAIDLHLAEDFRQHRAIGAFTFNRDNALPDHHIYVRVFRHLRCLLQKFAHITGRFRRQQCEVSKQSMCKKVSSSSSGVAQSSPACVASRLCATIWS